jgi:hypothetical protein
MSGLPRVSGREVVAALAKRDFLFMTNGSNYMHVGFANAYEE